MPRNTGDFGQGAGSQGSGYVYNGAWNNRESGEVVPPITLKGHTMKLERIRHDYIVSCSDSCGWQATAATRKHGKWLHDNHKAHVAGVPGPSFYQPNGHQFEKYEKNSKATITTPRDEDLFK